MFKKLKAKLAERRLEKAIEARIAFNNFVYEFLKDKEVIRTDEGDLMLVKKEEKA